MSTAWIAYNPVANVSEIGYHWINGRFGPPPGIDRAEKEQLGKDFCQKISLLTQQKSTTLISALETVKVMRRNGEK